MKELTRCFTVMFLALTLGANAQDLSGNWQGTLHSDKDLRLILNFSKGAKDAWAAKLYSIDQGAAPINASSVVQQGSTVKVTIDSTDGVFDGKLATDGNSLTGTWTQGQTHPLPLTLVRSTPETAWEIPKPPQLKPMAADADPSFEVATIKPINPDQPGSYFRVNGRTFMTHNLSLSGMIQFAYGVQAKQIVNAPDWMHHDTYDIAAIPNAEGRPSDKQWKSMVKKLLADRFKLSFHQEERELPVFALTVTKEGAKNLTENTSGGSGLATLFFRGIPGGIMLPARDATMADFCRLLQEVVLDRPVVDHTGLASRYDFTLKWAPDQSQFGGRVPPKSDAPDAPPELFTAIQEQIGLKLESTKASVLVLAIDRMEKPSEN